MGFFRGGGVRRGRPGDGDEFREGYNRRQQDEPWEWPMVGEPNGWAMACALLADQRWSLYYLTVDHVGLQRLCGDVLDDAGDAAMCLWEGPLKRQLHELLQERIQQHFLAANARPSQRHLLATERRIEEAIISVLTVALRRWRYRLHFQLMCDPITTDEASSDPLDLRRAVIAYQLEITKLRR